MESSRSVRMEKRGYEQAVQDDDAENHLPESKRRRLPALARFLFLVLPFFIYLFN